MKNKIINSKLVSNFKWLGWKKQRTKTYSFKKCVFVFVSHSLLLCASKALHVIHFTFCIDLLFLIFRSIRHSIHSHGPFLYFNETESLAAVAMTVMAAFDNGLRLRGCNHKLRCHLLRQAKPRSEIWLCARLNSGNFYGLHCIYSTINELAFLFLLPLKIDRLHKTPSHSQCTHKIFRYCHCAKESLFPVLRRL